MQPYVTVAHNSLHERTGLGNDFLGWINWPVDYDKDEFARIKKAAEKLYGGYDKLSEESRTFIETVYQNPDLTQLYAKVREDEKTNKDILIEFEDNYPDVLNGDNLTDILKAARAKEKRLMIF